MGTAQYKGKIRPRIFKGRRRRTGRRRRRGALTRTTSLSPVEPIPGTRPLTKKRQLSPGSSVDVSEFDCVAALEPESSVSACGSGNFNPIPFRRPRDSRSTSRIETVFTGASGPTHPRPNAVRVEPFSTSVLKVLARVFATTTKICTVGGSSRARARTFHATDATLLLVAA